MFFYFDKNDYLIHQKYGIGKFVGLEKLTINNTSLDFFKIEYLNSSFLLVPSYNISVFKFHSSKNSNTKIEHLGKSCILKKQQKIKEKIEKMAHELIEIYKARESISAPSFLLNDDYLTFCDDFEHELTKSQSKAIQEITEDLSKTRPMDRLLCGDVGFGKTEVASRAIALALSNGFKAILIVPTTILASQHFDSLSRRFEKIGKTCSFLSKLNDSFNFVKKEWQKGKVDLLITTAHHKGVENLLIDKLGIIVLDEEHHFGVKFKEKLRLKTHFLQLSATPIPRTLQLSLSKIKDISLLEVPPLGRKEIKVKLVSISELNLEDIIFSEVKRGGKVFLVVPRIQFIEEITKLISFISFTVLHGQLSREETNEALNKFTRGKSNVLISTNIIESGCNILNANLMIVFYAHMFGVAQLHQLKGRVGRADKQGTVYLVLPKSIKEVSTERIRMIQQHSSLGGGLTLSMKDMELRGSGTVVGYKQSGDDYGFGAEMYFDILSEYVNKYKIVRKSENRIAWIGFANANIPSDYIVDEKIRFAFYKKLSSISKKKELNLIIEDLEEFGMLPESLIAFLEIVRINLLSNYLVIRKVIKTLSIINVFYDDISSEVFFILQKKTNVDCLKKSFSLNTKKLDLLLLDLENHFSEVS